MFIAPRMIPYFNAIWGMRRSEEKSRLSRNAQKDPEGASQRVGDGDVGPEDRFRRQRSQGLLRRARRTAGGDAGGARRRATTSRNSPTSGRSAFRAFPDALTKRVKRDAAVKEIARCFLSTAGLTIPGELARVTGLSRPEAGRGNRALVKEGFATMLAPGWYNRSLHVPTPSVARIRLTSGEAGRFRSGQDDRPGDARRRSLHQVRRVAEC